MIQQRQRVNSNRQQRSILALGLGSSVILHLGLIAVISYWWRSPAPVDDPSEITLVAPSEIEPVTVAPSPPLAKSQKISITHPPAQVAQPKPTGLKSVSKPAVVISMPKPVAIAVKPISKTLQTAAKPTPKSLPIQPKVKPNPSPIQTSRVNLPVNPKPASKTLTPNPIQTPLIDPPIATKSTPKPAQSQPKIKPTTTPVVNPPFTLPTIQPPKTTAIPTPLSSSIATNSLPQTNSPPLPVKPKSIEASMPTNQPVNTPNSTPTTTSDLTPSTEPKSTVRSTPIEQPSGGNSSNPFAAPSQARSPGGIFTGNGSQFNPPDRGNLSPQNSSTPGSGNSDSAEPTLRDRMGNSAPPGNSNPMATSQPTAAGLQCIQHCEIPNLRDLQDRDGGKDRLRIRIVIDPHGLLLAATISKSSDNPQIDAIVLEGIKQMQFKPSGQIIKGIIKANILL